jgi:hypothetical protein
MPANGNVTITVKGGLDDVRVIREPGAEPTTTH